MERESTGENPLFLLSCPSSQYIMMNLRTFIYIFCTIRMYCLIDNHGGQSWKWKKITLSSIYMNSHWLNEWEREREREREKKRYSIRASTCRYLVLFLFLSPVFVFKRIISDFLSDSLKPEIVEISLSLSLSPSFCWKCKLVNSCFVLPLLCFVLDKNKKVKKFSVLENFSFFATVWKKT